jgi:hypothetical protein
MERRKIVGWILTAIGVGLLFLIFYQAYTAYSMLTEASFQTPAQLSIPSPVGEVPIEVPGLGSIPKILKVIADAIYFGVMIAAASKIAGKGIDLLKA